MKLVILAAMILLSINTFPQPFLGMAAMDKGAGIQIGILMDRLELSAAYKVPYRRADLPAIFSVSAGKLFFITKNNGNNYLVSTSIGVASYRVKDFTNYEAGGEEIIKVAEIVPIYSLELGKDAYLGRVFISANYCKDFYYGIGIKVFLRD